MYHNQYRLNVLIGAAAAAAAGAAGVRAAAGTAEALAGAAGVRAAAPDAVGGPDLSKYLSNAAFAFPGGPKGVAALFSFSPARSLLADRARWRILLAVDILEEVEILLWLDAVLMSDPDPNSLSS